ncbi:24512_t:CDS:1, partial [Dentiscutata erythropus]
MNNNGMQQRAQNINIGGPQNANGQLPRVQNNPNRFDSAIQQYNDLVNGADPFTKTQDIENPPQQFS